MSMARLHSHISLKHFNKLQLNLILSPSKITLVIREITVCFDHMGYLCSVCKLQLERSVTDSGHQSWAILPQPPFLFIWDQPSVLKRGYIRRLLAGLNGLKSGAAGLWSVAQWSRGRAAESALY